MTARNYADTKAIRTQLSLARMRDALKDAASAAYRANQRAGTPETRHLANILGELWQQEKERYLASVK